MLEVSRSFDRCAYDARRRCEGRERELDDRLERRVFARAVVCDARALAPPR